MLLSLLNNGFNQQDFIQLVYFIIIWFMTLTVHECAHGYTAYKMGDPTAKNMGRLTLNPVKHIDPMGLIMILIIGFGWAKPVMINPRNFKNPKRGMAISALAGPGSNIIMAVIGVILYNILNLIILKNGFYEYDYEKQILVINGFLESALTFAYLFAILNISFAIFNLIPIPPLDGSRIASYFMPPKLSYYYNYVERYGLGILFLLALAANFSRYVGFLKYLNVFAWLQTAANWVYTGINYAVHSIFALFGG